ncbi:MAG: SOS response-associated peptidase [Planctomycetes bacterium]|nr:SOS response-associated peptidase [Planctomycetota bacterium]
MCGRFTLSAPTERLADEFDIPNPPALPPRYNIAPTQLIAAVALKPDGEHRGIVRVPWGMVPAWADDPNAAPRLFNARAESVAFKFGECFRERRCLIPADGFYEWKAFGKKKHACHFSRADGGVFAFASLWDVWADEDVKLVGACMVTTTPNELVQPFHERMPVILPRENYKEWLDLETPEKRLLSLLKPYPAELMRAKQVGPAVNSSKNEGPACIEPRVSEAKDVTPALF